MNFAGKIGTYEYGDSSASRVRLLAIRLQLALYAIYCYIIIIRLLQTMVGNEISG